MQFMLRVYQRIARQTWRFWLPLSLCLFGGCYDGDSLLKEAQSSALNMSFAEVDLGTFDTTLPRDPNTGMFTTVNLHIFGTVLRTRLSAVEKQLKSDDYLVRYQTLTAIRKTNREELADPKLEQLRNRIEQVVNEVLTDAPLREVGFYQLTLRGP